MVGVGGNMLQQMAEYGIRHAGGHMGIAGHIVMHDAFDNVVEKFSAHFLEKAVLGLEMGIEGASPDVGPVDNILDGDLE